MGEGGVILARRGAPWSTALSPTGLAAHLTAQVDGAAPAVLLSEGPIGQSCVEQEAEGAQP